MNAEVSLRQTVQLAHGTDADDTWRAAVRRASRLVGRQWPEHDWSSALTHSLQALGLVLYILDPDEDLDDTAIRAAVTPFVQIDGWPNPKTTHTAVSWVGLIAGLPQDDPRRPVADKLTTRVDTWDVGYGESPAAFVPDPRAPLMPALEWLWFCGFGGQATAPDSPGPGLTAEGDHPQRREEDGLA
ncbi:hypothetical protein [Streptomyces sp. NPDC127098]|uniref:hypothetical protein n=1 Tax=Streptomyces sp. NPDC127098 TaxID=3347137 RepID=UPI00365DFF6E